MIRKQASAFVVVFVLAVMIGCQESPHPRESGGSGDPNSAAGKVGKAAYKVEKQTEKVAKEVGQKLEKAAKDAHAGYKGAEKASDH